MCQRIIYLLCFRFNHNCCAWFAGLRLMPGSTGHLWLREVLEAVPHVEPGARGNRGNGDTTSRAKKSETFPYIERDGNVAWYGKTNGTVEEIYGDVVFFLWVRYHQIHIASWFRSVSFCSVLLHAMFMPLEIINYHRRHHHHQQHLYKQHLPSQTRGVKIVLIV